MTSIVAPSYLTRRPIELALQKFATGLPRGVTVYDIGCGHKPYAQLFMTHRYVGIDTDIQGPAEIKYNSGENVPLPDASADALVCTETLQHCRNPQQVVDEIYRLLKPGGKAFITVPFGIKMLGEPRPSDNPTIPVWRDDYWRFTKYGLLRLVHQFTVISITETTGYRGALLQLVNYAIASMNLGIIARPVYLFNNIAGRLSDSFIYWVTHRLLRGRRFYDLIYTSFTTNYIVVIKKT